MIKPNQILFFGVVAVVALVIYYSFTGEQINSGYLTEIETFRQDKNIRFKSHDDSPLDKKQKLIFDSLSYYAPNPAMRIQADLERLDENEVINLKTTKDGGVEQYIRWAKATFQLMGKEHEVVLLKKADQVNKKMLHLFFKDLSSGNETYGGGRYVDIEPGKTTCMIDFNMAYNPYCAYNDFYICPIPPRENYLDIEIQAGEKKPLMHSNSTN
ncbi:MAG: DUF1684 domain-containing protein [Flammeovirgaceae bacterium]